MDGLVMSFPKFHYTDPQTVCDPTGPTDKIRTCRDWSEMSDETKSGRARLVEFGTFSTGRTCLQLTYCLRPLISWRSVMCDVWCSAIDELVRREFLAPATCTVTVLALVSNWPTGIFYSALTPRMHPEQSILFNIKCRAATINRFDY